MTTTITPRTLLYLCGEAGVDIRRFDEGRAIDKPGEAATLALLDGTGYDEDDSDVSLEDRAYDFTHAAQQEGLDMPEPVECMTGGRSFYYWPGVLTRP